ncbi:DUF481 domain-containing protein [Cryomorphaceae bacterium 1068]|nr:DUF481 domain-containing protein [Cryomorphaceae bacterium 1068]
MKNILVASFLLTQMVLFAQKDSLIFDGGQVIVGEVKEMNRNILTIETDYSNTDFKIEWDKITEFYSDQLYMIQITDRTIFTNATMSFQKPGEFKIIGESNSGYVPMSEVVYLRQVDTGFWSKLSASIDLGFNLTKASNLQQFNASTTVGYKSAQWTYRVTYQQNRSEQDDVDPVRRTEVNANADYALHNGIFFGAGVNFLSNTEQLLDLRTTGSAGVGYYLVRNNEMYWQSTFGVAINNENFTDVPEEPSEDRDSFEGLLGTELNLYNLGDIDLFTNIIWYPSFTEEGRNRINYSIDVSYDMPLDFYIKTGLTVNYDNQPVAGASETDYVFTGGIGWEF